MGLKTGEEEVRLTKKMRRLLGGEDWWRGHEEVGEENQIQDQTAEDNDGGLRNQRQDR